MVNAIIDAIVDAIAGAVDIHAIVRNSCNSCFQSVKNRGVLMQ